VLHVLAAEPSAARILGRLIGYSLIPVIVIVVIVATRKSRKNREKQQQQYWAQQQYYAQQQQQQQQQEQYGMHEQFRQPGYSPLQPCPQQQQQFPPQP
jgi:hypothetical protein